VFTVWLNVFRQAATAGREPAGTWRQQRIGVTPSIAKRWAQPVYTTAARTEKCRWCESLGAIRAINYKNG